MVLNSYHVYPVPVVSSPVYHACRRLHLDVVFPEVIPHAHMVVTAVCAVVVMAVCDGVGKNWLNSP